MHCQWGFVDTQAGRQAGRLFVQEIKMGGGLGGIDFHFYLIISTSVCWMFLCIVYSQ